MVHPDEDLLDHYAVGQVTDEGLLARVEERLLNCEKCRQAVALVGRLRSVKKSSGIRATMRGE